MEPKIEFTRITSDINGNPRYVCHFFNFLTNDEQHNRLTRPSESVGYMRALSRAKNLGGRKFNTMQYGGGIVFQSHNIQDLEKRILDMMQNLITVRFFMETGNGTDSATPFAVWSAPGSTNEGFLMGYAHVGQHGEYHPDYLLDKKRATPKQYAPLKKELEQRGYYV